MIRAFVAAFDGARSAIRDEWRTKLPDSYDDIVKRVIVCLSDVDVGYSGSPDPERITVIDHGHYQGTRVYVVGAAGYQPDAYWYARISYGSCSGCDAFQHAVESAYCGDDEGTPDSVLDQLMILALHVVQRLKRMDDAEDER
jgi:broad specificity phosphatase PhoE